MAPRHRRRGSAGRRPTSSVVSVGTEERINRNKCFGSLYQRSADGSEVVVTRRQTMAFQGRCEGWARRPGASPTMRMTASWLRSAHGSTEYKAVAPTSAPRWRGSPRIMSADLPAARPLMSAGERRAPTIDSDTAPNDLCTSRRQL